MKDIKFSGGALSSGVTFRVDSISGQGNLTIMETYGLQDRQIDPNADSDPIEVALINEFSKLPGTFNDFTAFAAANGLDMVILETNGNNPIQAAVSLVITAPTAGSSTADTTPTFTGTGTPGAAVALTLASVVTSGTVGSNGAWSLTPVAAVAAASYTASVALSLGGVSVTKTRAFIIT